MGTGCGCDIERLEKDVDGLCWLLEYVCRGEVPLIRVGMEPGCKGTRRDISQKPRDVDSIWVPHTAATTVFSHCRLEKVFVDEAGAEQRFYFFHAEIDASPIFTPKIEAAVRKIVRWISGTSRLFGSSPYRCDYRGECKIQH